MASDCVQKHGAVVVRAGSVLSVGINKWKNNPGSIEKCKASSACSVHAEIDAISRLKDAKGATIYVSRINRQGEPMLSKPCKACMKALEDAGIKRIVYTEKGCW